MALQRTAEPIYLNIPVKCIACRCKFKNLQYFTQAFHHADKWYMMYIICDDNGYETALARSSNLRDWEPLGKIMTFTPGSQIFLARRNQSTVLREIITQTRIEQ